MDKQILINWLKEHDFYNQWIEAYNLDNEIYNDVVPLEDFLGRIRIGSWFHTGIESIVFSAIRPEVDKELLDKINDWRKENLFKFNHLDEEWIEYAQTVKV